MEAHYTLNSPPVVSFLNPRIHAPTPALRAYNHHEQAGSNMGLSEIRGLGFRGLGFGVPYFGVLIIRILLFSVLVPPIFGNPYIGA